MIATRACVFQGTVSNEHFSSVGVAYASYVVTLGLTLAVLRGGVAAVISDQTTT